jgi:hypothetical protein
MRREKKLLGILGNSYNSQYEKTTERWLNSIKKEGLEDLEGLKFLECFLD